jgi:hypothetical protein
MALPPTPTTPNLDSVAVPAVIVASANAYTLWNEHWEHVAHSTPMEERPQYEYMNIRSKAYPWGDGDKVRICRIHPAPCRLWQYCHGSALAEQIANSSGIDPLLERQAQLPQEGLSVGTVWIKLMDSWRSYPNLPGDVMGKGFQYRHGNM